MRRMLLCTVLALCGAGLIGVSPAVSPAAAQLRNAPPAMIFVANGSGDSTAVTENLGLVIADARLPFRVNTVRWTSYGGAVQDHNYVANHRTSAPSWPHASRIFASTAPPSGST
jgi:hypothetical protein